MNRLPRFLLPLTLLLAACEPQVPANLSPEAAAEFIAMRDTLEGLHSGLPGRSLFGPTSEYEEQLRRMVEEQAELLEQYAETGDVRLRTPMVHQTLLHFAVQHRKEALVRELLRQGADPNATCDFSFLGQGEMDAPLAWVAVPEMDRDTPNEKPFAETAIRLIDALAEAGARMDDAAGGHVLFMLSLTKPEDGEDVYLHMLERGANPRLGYMCKQGEEAGYFQQAMNRVWRTPWPRAQARLIDMGHLSADWRNEEQKTLLFSLVEKLIYMLRSGAEHYVTAHSEQEFNAAVQEDAGQKLAAIRLLLEKGADPNAPQGGGWTPLTYAASITPQDMLPGSMYTDKDAALAIWRQLMDLLLSSGGDADATVPVHHGKPARRVRECLPATAGIAHSEG